MRPSRTTARLRYYLTMARQEWLLPAARRLQRHLPPVLWERLFRAAHRSQLFPTKPDGSWYSWDEIVEIHRRLRGG